MSSQGDSSFAVWRVDSASPVYTIRFRVAANGSVDTVNGADGIDAYRAVVGPYPKA